MTDILTERLAINLVIKNKCGKNYLDIYLTDGEVEFEDEAIEQGVYTNSIVIAEIEDIDEIINRKDLIRKMYEIDVVYKNLILNAHCIDKEYMYSNEYIIHLESFEIVRTID